MRNLVAFSEYMNFMRTIDDYGPFWDFQFPMVKSTLLSLTLLYHETILTCLLGLLLLFFPTFLSFLEFTLKNLFAWAGSSFISWHATKDLFFFFTFFSPLVLGHDGVARCQYYTRSTMMFDMKEKKGKFSTIIILSMPIMEF